MDTCTCVQDLVFSPRASVLDLMVRNATTQVQGCADPFQTMTFAFHMYRYIFNLN